MKSLPTLREKKRYIFFQVHSKGPVPYYQMKQAIFDSLLDFLGERDLAKASVRLIKNLYSSGKGVVQTNPKAVDSVKLALALIHQIGEERVLFQTLRVSGTIKSGKSKSISSG